MNIKDKIILDGIKSAEDSAINKGSVDLIKVKSEIFSSISGLSKLISPEGSIFNAIKGKVGNFSNQFTNSFDIVKSNKDQFFSKISGSVKIPKDLL